MLIRSLLSVFFKKRNLFVTQFCKFYLLKNIRFRMLNRKTDRIHFEEFKSKKLFENRRKQRNIIFTYNIQTKEVFLVLIAKNWVVINHLENLKLKSHEYLLSTCLFFRRFLPLHKNDLKCPFTKIQNTKLLI